MLGRNKALPVDSYQNYFSFTFANLLFTNSVCFFPKYAYRFYFHFKCGSENRFMNNFFYYYTFFFFYGFKLGHSTALAARKINQACDGGGFNTRTIVVYFRHFYSGNRQLENLPCGWPPHQSIYQGRRSEGSCEQKPS